jgi:AcrR family transcriptional regulator
MYPKTDVSRGGPVVLPGVQPEAGEHEPKLGLRERKRLRTRHAILNAAWVHFTQDGVANATIRSIAETAEVSEVTVYNYFPSRAELVDAVVEHQGSMDRTVAELAERPESEGPIEALRGITAGQRDLTKAEFQRAVKIVRMINSDPILRGASRNQQTFQTQALAEALLPRAIAVGMSKQDLHLLCVAWLGMLDGLSEMKTALASPKAWADASDYALSLLDRGWGR